MSRSSFLILLGILTALAPFSGIPFSWLSVLLPIFGFTVAIVGFSVRLEKVRAAKANGLTASSAQTGTSAPTPTQEASPVSAPAHGVSPI